MFSLAILIGIYSYIIFFLGIAGLLFKDLVLFTSLVYIAAILLFYRNKIFNLSNKTKTLTVSKDKMSLFLSILIIIQLLINLIGVLGPEISFDALWYHLTLPKIYILNNYIFHISGNLLYYSDIPKLTEMLYIPALMFSNEAFAKFIHFSFGLLTLAVLYSFSRKYLSKSLSLLVLIVFYSNLLVGWESITAYIDLSRTFFELLALLAFVNWSEKKEKKWIVVSGVMLGFAISSKVISIESLFIFLILFVFQLFLNKEKILNFVKNISTFIFCSVSIPLPWFVFSFLNTKNPLYPFFDNRINIGTNFVIPNILNFPSDFLTLFLFSNDPISPIYLVAFPLIIVFFRKAKKEFKIFYIYSFLGLLLWYLTPKIGGGRFILPYLPIISILAVYSIKQLASKYLHTFLIVVAVLISIISIGYRGIANAKFIPFILEKESKAEFLTKNLNFSFGDFYDTDDYFKNNIKPADKVLLFGFHNLYYVDFPFIDSSWVKKGDRFNYIAVQNSTLPEKFNNWRQIYYNPVTKVKLYSLGGKQWVYLK